MMMKSLLLCSLAALALAGCGGPSVEVKGDNGETVKVNAKGDMSVTDKDGKTTSVATSDGKVTVKDDKGSTTMESKGGEMTVKGPDGSMEAGVDKVKETELGVPFYPGSSTVSSQKATDAKGKVSLLSIRTSKDAPSKVSDFYKGHFKPETTGGFNQDGNESAILGGKLADGRKITVTAAKNQSDAATTITIAVVQE